MTNKISFNFEKYLDDRRKIIEVELNNYLKSENSAFETLWESMRYSVLSGGKRIRAILCLASAELALSLKEKIHNEDFSLDTRVKRLTMPCACAIEIIHAMSLIHDDLPCMDNDDFRRGLPTNHKKFGEAIALLAGDALLSYATEILLSQSSPEIDPKKLIQVVLELAYASGAKGMVGGQVIDIETTGIKSTAKSFSQEKLIQSNFSQQEILNLIHERKTGALIRFASWSGACLVGADQSIQKKLADFGEILGLSFQIADDLLDISGDIKTLGKTPGKDLVSGKLTWITVHGIDSAKSKLIELEKAAKQVLNDLDPKENKIEVLLALLNYAINRNN